jgi:hypothetical protein
MRRSSVLSQVVQECKKQGITGLLGEVLIRPTEDAVRAKRRSIFIVGATQADLERITEESRTTLGDNADYEAAFCTHGTIEAPNFSEQLISLSDTRLENNWRCRMIRLNQINFTNADQFQKLVLSATWRLVVTRRGAEFFVRHDIFPVLWSPGYSVAGFPDLNSSIGHEMDFFANRQSRFFDDHNDVLKVFAGDAGAEFHELTVAGHQQLRISQIQITEGNFRVEVLAALREHFQNR